MQQNSVEYFEAKVISWRDYKDNRRESTILLQNANGPCPLVALVNTLVLAEQEDNNQSSSRLQESKTSLASYTSGKDKISVKGILDQLGNLLLEIIAENDGNLPSGIHKDTNDVLGLLPKLITGMNISTRFDGTFDDCPEMALFRIYSVDIVHGWVCDPEHPEYSLVNEVGSYDESQSLMLRESELRERGETDTEEYKSVRAKVDATHYFLDENRTQLSEYGLHFVEDILNSHSPAVFFRNDHFSTIIKTGNGLYTLITDAGFMHERDVVWQSISSVDGGQDGFHDGGFRPIDGEAFNQNAHANDDDYLIAQQLQIAADSELAQELAEQFQRENPRSNNTNANNNSNSRPSRPQRQYTGAQNVGKKKPKCIIM